jgi:hypothetical protein
MLAPFSYADQHQKCRAEKAPGSLAMFAAIRLALDYCTSHVFCFFDGSPHSHLPVCEL